MGLKPVAHVSEVIFQAEQTDVLDLAVLRTAKDGSVSARYRRSRNRHDFSEIGYRSVTGIVLAMHYVPTVGHSVAIGWCLENTFKGKSCPGRLHLDAFARERYFVTTIVRFLEIKTELVLLDRPFADFLRSH